MNKDLEIIKFLENKFEIKLGEIDMDTIIYEGTKNGYLIENKKVIGLSLVNLNFKEIPEEIFKLKKLIGLCLVNNKISKVPKEIKNLTFLKYLLLNINQLSTIPDEIEKLTSLKRLILQGNNLTNVSSAIFKLNNLERLHLADNRITALPVEITTLGMDISFQWARANGINVKNNPIETPPIEIIEKGIGSIKEYFKSLEDEKQALNEVKVLLVGDGGSGKTSLVKQLFNEKFNPLESQTHGINIKKWKINESGEKINVNYWDFGGQQIMHATHQFFLSKRSLYILVLDGRKEEDAEYWLKHIESFGGDSAILIVMNKLDEHPSFDVNRLFLKSKYEGIRSFHQISCAENIGINSFKKSLIQEIKKVELIHTTWSQSWFNVKSYLENMKSNFISYNEFKSICSKENIHEKLSQETLVDFLNDLGVILHFKDFELLDTHVLEPKWVTEAVYKIINSQKLADCKGLLKLELLDEILEKRTNVDFSYPKDKYRYIVDLMKKFELCYSIDNNTVLIPDLLEIQEPKFEFNYQDSLKFIIEYDFLPKSVIPRFIVKLHKDIYLNYQWLTGVVLNDESFKSSAVIKADERDKKIFIWVYGALRRDYFSVIRHAFRDINKSFKKLTAIEKVPMPNEPKISVSYDHLIRLERKEINSYIPDGSENEYKIKDLLGSIYVENKNEAHILRILKKLQTQSDNQETLLQKANDVFQLQPNFFGLGINLNALINKLFNK